MIIRVCFMILLGLLVPGSVAGRLSPEDDCEQRKVRMVGKYVFCRHKAEVKAARSGNHPPDFTRCDQKLSDHWVAEEENAARQGYECLDVVTVEAIRTFAVEHTDTVVAAIRGGAIPECGDGAINRVGEQCDGGDFGGETCQTQGFSDGTLLCDSACRFVPVGCTGVNYGGLFPATGQTVSYGPASDGEIRAGAGLSFTDNGDGTITDNNTALMWEKKDDSGGIHDKDNTYTWCGPSCDTANIMDGSVTSVFLYQLNDVSGGGSNCFAGYCDWRLPNVKELQSIVNHDRFRPALSRDFHRAETCAGCMDLTLDECSCAARSGPHHTSTTTAGNSAALYWVDFDAGNTGFGFDKSRASYVRAVRGGLESP